MKKIKFLKQFPNINTIKDLQYKNNLIMNKNSNNTNIIEWKNIILFKNLKIFIKGNNNTIKIDENTILNNSCIYINGDNNIITINKNCTLKELNLVCKNNNNSIQIGKYVSTAGKYWGSVDIHVMDKTSISIGDECMLSGNIIIRTDDGHPIYDKNKNQLNKSSDIIIGDHVWIAQDVKILKGVKISSNSIIGIGSVVTKSFNKKRCIIAGNPAKAINKTNYFEWQRKNIKN